MADQKISQLNSLTKSTVASNDVLPIVDTSALETKQITYQELMRPQDNNFRIAGSSDNTKLVAFEVDGLTTGTTRTITVPDADLVMVGTTTVQTLTNKTLTSPQFNFGSDAVGDIYYRNSGGTTVRLPIGTVGQIMSVSSGNIPEWIANPSAADASTIVKGVSEEGTQAEVDAGTAAGGTSARLFVNPSTLRAKLVNSGVADTGTATAYAIAPSPAITAYATYQVFYMKALNTNTTTTPTLNVNALGTKTIVNQDGSALIPGQIKAGGVYALMYDGTNMQILSQQVDLNYIPNSIPSAQLAYTQQLSIPSTAINGWTLGNTPTIVTYPNGIVLSKNSSTAGIWAAALTGQNSNLFSINNLLYSSGIDLSLSYYFTPELTSNSGTGIGYVHGFGGSTINPIITTTGLRICFVHYGGNIYALTDNNSTVTTVTIGADPGAVKKRYTIRWNGTAATFYIDGILVATITTTIPSGDMGIMFSCSRTAGSVSFNLSHLTLSETLA